MRPSFASLIFIYFSPPSLSYLRFIFIPETFPGRPSVFFHARLHDHSPSVRMHFCNHFVVSGVALCGLVWLVVVLFFFFSEWHRARGKWAGPVKQNHRRTATLRCLFCLTRGGFLPGVKSLFGNDYQNHHHHYKQKNESFVRYFYWSLFRWNDDSVNHHFFIQIYLSGFFFFFFCGLLNGLNWRLF